MKHHHFVLVHGSCHGAWCWYKLTTRLRSAGHRVTAVDLTGSGAIDPTPLDQISSISDYLEPLIRFLSSLSTEEDGPMILVGHSYGGLSIALAMERFPDRISAGVFITAYMPTHTSPPGAFVQEYFKRLPNGFAMDCEFKFDEGPENPPTSVLFGPNFSKNKAYLYCSLQDIELARTLVRPSKLFVRDLETESLLTEPNYGSVKKGFIVCEEDQVMSEDFQGWMIGKCEPDVVKVMKKAGHMAMLNKPDELYVYLLEIASIFDSSSN